MARVYFFKKKNGEIFASELREAYQIFHYSTFGHEYIGTSSGAVFQTIFFETNDHDKAFQAELEEALKDKTPPTDISFEMPDEKNQRSVDEMRKYIKHG